MFYKIKDVSVFELKKIMSFGLGISLVVVLSIASSYLAGIGWIETLGLSTLTIAILLGIFIGNTFFGHIATYTDKGVDLSKNTLLRLGIILYGFRITFQQIISVGWSGLVVAVLMIACTFSLAIMLGAKVFKLDTQTAILIGAGSSICGAAAIMATEPIIKGQAHKVSVAVATVVVFGTLAMFIYPLLYPYLGLSEHNYGIFVGASIHEVAQVVVAGKSVGDAAAATAVIEKMLRVMLLAPFLMILPYLVKINHQADGHSKSPITIPWFAVFFIVAALINSLVVIPEVVLTFINGLDTLLLTMAMVALGLRTHLGAIKQAGIKPLLLAGCLFLFLLVGGLIINEVILYLVSGY